MRQFHSILAQYTPLVEGYVLDARLSPSGHAQVQLTVLVHPATSHWLLNQISARLRLSEDDEDLRKIALDFDLGRAAWWKIDFIVTVRHLEPQGRAQHA